MAPQQHLHAGRGDVLDGAPQHPAVSRATGGAASARALGPLLLLFLLLLLVFLLLADRTGDREEEDGEKG